MGRALKTIALILFVGFNLAQAQNWDIPEDEKSKTSAFLFSDENRKTGEDLYGRNCKSCHGDPTKANYSKLNPIPKDFGSKEFQANSDGEIHYKISEGKGLMPSFKTILGNDEIWTIVAYARSFNAEYVQPPLQIVGKTAAFSKNVFVNLEYDEKINKIRISLIDKDSTGVEKLLGNVQVELYAKRTFGKLQIGKKGTTNQKGIVEIDFPKTLPQNTEGKVEFVVQLTDGASGAQINKATSLSIGAKNPHVNLLEERAMWNVSAMAPIWLLLAFLGVTLSVWGGIFYILKKLNEMRKSKSKAE